MGGNNTVTVIQEFGMGTTDVLTAQYFCSLIGVASVESTSIKKSNSITIPKYTGVLNFKYISNSN